MNVQWPTGVGVAVSIVVVVLGILMAVGVLPATPQTVGVCLAALAICRLV